MLNEQVRWIVVTAALLTFGLLAGLLIGFFWGRATGTAQGSYALRSFAEQMFRAFEGLLAQTNVAGTQLSQLVGVIKERDRSSAEAADRVETPHLAAIAQSLYTLQGRLEDLRDQAAQKSALDSAWSIVSSNTEKLPAVVPAPPNHTTAPQHLPDAPSVEEDCSPGELPEASRQPCQAVQRYAPYPAGAIPTVEMFRDIRCLDKSDTEIRFLTTVSPTTTMVVVTSGNESEVEFHTARVMSVKDITHALGTVYDVNCRLVGRLHLSLS